MVTSVLETALITVQAWRGVPSHFNLETPLDAAVSSTLAVGGAIIVLTIAGFFLTGIAPRFACSVTLPLPRRFGLAMLFVSMVVGALMIAKGVTLYKNFFDSLKGKRAGRKMGVPRFKSRKDNRQAIRFTKGAFTVRGNGRLSLAKIGDVRVAWSRDLPSTPSSVTVVKTADGRYFASFVVEVGDETLPAAVGVDGPDIEIGIDLGLSAFAVDQNGRVIDNPRFLHRAERKLKRLQRAVSRKQRGSNNRTKARKKLARQHAKVTDTRADWLHKATTSIVRENQTIVLEDLAVSGLARTRLAKSVHDASWGTFRRLLTEKYARYGRDLVVIDRWLPTSQTCSVCGSVDGKKPLSVREWECPCGAVHDRDTNAARNILAAGRAERRNACEDQVRPATRAQVDEAGTHRDRAA
ncbi:RNA-guided endonuclease InsQ/TnpB family protein [Parasphingorhabdus pacifica]